MLDIDDLMSGASRRREAIQKMDETIRDVKRELSILRTEQRITYLEGWLALAVQMGDVSDHLITSGRKQIDDLRKKINILKSSWKESSNAA